MLTPTLYLKANQVLFMSFLHGKQAEFLFLDVYLNLKHFGGGSIQKHLTFFILVDGCSLGQMEIMIIKY